MHPIRSRRSFLALAAGAAGAAMVAACSKPPASGTVAGDGSVTINHAFGSTRIPAPPKSVVCAGLTGQDELLAVGVVPIAVTEWFGNQPFAVWPWAQPALGPAQPAVLNLNDGIQVEKISALKPDLIIATNAGLDADTYKKLSAIAPTIAQSGQDAFFEPWKEQATVIGQAVFKADDMKRLIDGVDAKFTGAGQAHPKLNGRKMLLVNGLPTADGVEITPAGWRTDFLTEMGIALPGGLDSFTKGQHAFVPRDQVATAFRDADVLIWTLDADEQRPAVLADPTVAQLSQAKTNRIVFPNKDLSAAITFASVLSYPAVADQLPPLLTAALA
ncbi:ABC transporter substrate-binding protein [Mycolicibacterium mucogenicum]|uniref:ABC transporter substrate-binding protein n=1 Tax=Mycolicibacterium mucogenicum TaxID=56689 RepID=UPI00226ABE6E|nr:ABC transporter substrate-binding protein [Mycolicibacterium mucogenicum]MCX8560304.1 ABC transporter substrate-binding protein [Mycolicibacterium mucogenicum]